MFRRSFRPRYWRVPPGLQGSTGREVLLEIVVIELAHQRFGVPVSAVREIVRAVSIVPLPNAPDVIEGVINVRGSVLPVFDLRKRLGFPEKSLEPEDQFVLAYAGEREVALHVDRAADLHRLDEGAVEDADAIVAGQRHVVGVAKLPDGLVLINDLDAFLSAAESGALDEALAAAMVSGGDG